MVEAKPTKKKSKGPRADNITVGVRVRPPLPRELADKKFTNCVAVDDANSRIFVSLRDEPVIVSTQSNEVPDGVAAYSFDHCFGPGSTQEEVYSATVQPAVQAVLEGFNATVFAYGQTGTGKTFSIQGTREDPGVAPRAISQLFQGLQAKMSNNDDLDEDSPLSEEEEKEEEEEKKEDEPEDAAQGDGEEACLMRQNTPLDGIQRQTSVFMSVSQIYNEVISDLIVKGQQAKTLKLRQSKDGTFFAEGIRQKQVTNTQQVMAELSKAQAKRQSASTSMNDESSRSHLILTLTLVEVTRRNELIGAKLNLVDLAGSERVKDSNVSGQNLQEACHINASLYNIAGVVDVLCKGKPKNLIPYRNSKLTSILQDSLGGNCKTTVLACLSPA